MPEALAWGLVLAVPNKAPGGGVHCSARRVLLCILPPAAATHACVPHACLYSHPLFTHCH